MQKQIMDFLKSENCNASINSKNYNLAITKMSKNEKLDFIFCQGNFIRGGLERKKLEYAGIYNKVDCKIYDIQYILNDKLEKNAFKDIGFDALKDKFTKSVNKKIKEKINNDINNIKIKSVDDVKDFFVKKNLQQLKDFDSSQKEQARDNFFKDIQVEDVVFNPHYSITYFDSLIIQYIMDKEKTVNDVANDWIEKGQENIFYIFKRNEKIKKELKDIYNDKDNEFYIAKDIIKAMKDTDYKTVNVTTTIDGKELTFKTEASGFRYYQRSYGVYNIIASDRSKFEELYGRYSKYTPKDITNITYSRKTVYEKK